MWFWRRFFSFSVLTVWLGLGLGLEPLWTWTWTWTRTSLDSDLTRTRTSLDLDLSWTRQRWTWLQPYILLFSTFYSIAHFTLISLFFTIYMLLCCYFYKPSAWPSLSPYRITPIHWLMARRRLWRNDVVRSYWRTRHPLLRFLCLHEAVTSPFVVAISDPIITCDYPFALRRLPLWNFVLLAVKCHGISPLYATVHVFHRSRRPTQ